MSILRYVFSTRFDDFGATIARLALGAVIFPHGAQKALGWFGGEGPEGTLQHFEKLGISQPIGMLAITAELAGSLALITGALGRLGAAGVAGNMLGAIRLVHQPQGFFMNWRGDQKGEGFEFHLLALGLAAAVLIRGSGALSIDALVGRRIKGSQEKVTLKGPDGTEQRLLRAS